MKAFSLLSQKGGVGKTTVALHLALAAAQRGHRTLLVDADPQGAVGLSLRGSHAERPGLATVLTRGASVREVCLGTKEPGLTLLPMGAIEPDALDDVHERLTRPESIAQVLSELDHQYDLAIVDTPAGLHGPSIGALRATGRALVPVQPRFRAT